MLLSVDNLGYIFGSKEHKIHQTCPETANKFLSDHISMDVRIFPSLSNSDVDTCFVFDNDQAKGSICIPEIFENRDCLVHVATAYSVDAQRSGIFPTNMEREVEDEDIRLSNFLLGLTIDNGRATLELPQNLPVVITFQHDGLKVCDLIFLLSLN